MGNAVAGSERYRKSNIRDGKRTKSGCGPSLREKIRKNATKGNSPGVETSEGGLLKEEPHRMYIPASEVLNEMKLNDPAFAAACADQSNDLSLAIAVISARGDMTQEQLAVAMETTQTAIARLESGRHKPSVRILERLAKVTGNRLVIHFEPIQDTVTA
jgi:DNA-binding XRE family transcriptional regulator